MMDDRQFRERAVVILANMARERESFLMTLFRGRWPVHHEPLRNDAANLLRDSGDNYFVANGERHVGNKL
jgi:hypothetical protein